MTANSFFIEALNWFNPPVFVKLSHFPAEPHTFQEKEREFILDHRGATVSFTMNALLRECVF